MGGAEAQAQHRRREAAAREFQERVEAAIQTVQELQKERSPKDKPARASTTDAEARVMKMGDGGFRPAYNVQYATAGSPLGGPRTIVGIKATSLGSDMGSLTPMAEQIQERTKKLPETVLADGGHAKHEDIAQLASSVTNTMLTSAPSSLPQNSQLRCPMTCLLRFSSLTLLCSGAGINHAGRFSRRHSSMDTGLRSRSG